MKRRKLILWSIVIPLIFIMIFFSCKKTEEAQTSKLSFDNNSIPYENDYGMPVKYPFFNYGMPVWEPINTNDIQYIPEEPTEIFEIEI